MDGPTPFGDLNAVLAALLAGAGEALGENLCALYLQGSFAVGDADVHSDVDFVAVTGSEPAAAEVERLQALHARLFALPSPWAQHLEGSYVPKEALRRRGAAQRSFWFLDNGAESLVLDPHCDTHLVRWVLREHGIPLAGPPPAALAGPVSSDELRAEARAFAEDYAAWAPEPTATGRMNRWKQAYLVTTFCRILHTLDTGRIVSKRVALEWALDSFPTEWRPLVRRALDDRAGPSRRYDEPADDELVDETLALAEWVVSRTRPRTR
jgi:Domain of unknown function (DUF4111)